MRSGNIVLGGGYLQLAGRDGYYWNMTSGGSNDVYRCGFSSSGIYPTYLNLGGRYLGFSARCLASGV